MIDIDRIEAISRDLEGACSPGDMDTALGLIAELIKEIRDQRKAWAEVERVDPEEAKS